MKFAVGGVIENWDAVATAFLLYNWVGGEGCADLHRVCSAADAGCNCVDGFAGES